MDQDSELQSEENEEARQQQWATEHLQMTTEMRKAKESKNEEAQGAMSQAKQLADRMAKLQKAYRIFNAANGILSIADFGISLILTCLVMNAQLVLGNGLKIKYVPPLTMPEILILAIVDLIVAIILGLIIILIVIINECTSTALGFIPTGLLNCAWKAL